MTILQVDDYRIDHTWGSSNFIVYLVFWIDDIDPSLASLADVCIHKSQIMLLLGVFDFNIRTKVWRN